MEFYAHKHKVNNTILPISGCNYTTKLAGPTKAISLTDPNITTEWTGTQKGDDNSRRKLILLGFIVFLNVMNIHASISMNLIYA